MYRHKKCRYVCGFVPLLDLNITKVVHFIETTKQIPKYFIYVVKHKFYPPHLHILTNSLIFAANY